MESINTIKYKRPIKYDKISLISPHTKGVYHMFTGLKKQLELTDTLIDNILPQDNELIKLKKALNWKDINKVYKECFPSRRGRASKKTDIALGLLILKHLYKKSDRDLVRDLHLNTSYMYFCGLSYDEVAAANKKGAKVIDSSTLTKIRARLGAERIEKIGALLTSNLILKKIIDGRHLFTDTTSLEKNIAYPTEVSLLSRIVAEAAAVSQNVRYKKDIIVTAAIAKAKKISKVYYSTSKKTKKLLNTCSKKLMDIAKDEIQNASAAVNEMGNVIHKITRQRFKKLLATGKEIISQIETKLEGNPLPKRILSYHETDAAALPKSRPGKAPCAFGAKLSLSVTGNGYITDYSLYNRNIADIDTLSQVLKRHKEAFGKKFKALSADRAYYDKDLIEDLEEQHKIILAIPHKKRRDFKITAKKKLLYKKRSAIEAKISEGKRMTGLSKSYYKGFAGDKIWTGLSVLALNLRQLLKDIDKKPELIYEFG
ncbi:MAG: transposase [Actinobacteria bacterium]|nr:transposase [Actinomycetota bacterium]